MKRNIDEVKKEVEGLRDGTGKPIDELIKPLVIGLVILRHLLLQLF